MQVKACKYIGGEVLSTASVFLLDILTMTVSVNDGIANF